MSDDLIFHFKKEIENHSYTQLITTNNSITFTNELGTWASTRFTNKWMNFSLGKFSIIEDSEFLRIEFYGELKRAWIISSLPSIVLIIIAIFLLNPTIGLLLILLLIWPMHFGLRLILEHIFFPVYLEQQRLKIQEECTLIRKNVP